MSRVRSTAKISIHASREGGDEAAADQPDSDGEASALYARFAALKRAGFTEAQALELVSGKGK